MRKWNMTTISAVYMNLCCVEVGMLRYLSNLVDFKQDTWARIAFSRLVIEEASLNNPNAGRTYPFHIGMSERLTSSTCVTELRLPSDWLMFHERMWAHECKLDGEVHKVGESCSWLYLNWACDGLTWCGLCCLCPCTLKLGYTEACIGEITKRRKSWKHPNMCLHLRSVC